MIYVYCDGAVEPKNPGGWGVGGWVVKRDDQRLFDGADDLGEYPEMTNNIAEYGAVRGALRDIINSEMWEDIVVRTDSQLIVQQLNKKWGTSSPHLLKLRDEVLELAKEIWNHHGSVRFEWIPRAQNKEADEMSRSLYHGRMAPGMPEPDYEAPRKRKR